VAARIFVLRRPREHAVTAGWLAGCLLQLPAVLEGSSSASAARLTGQGQLGQSLAFYAHDTLLPVFGWHLAWRLQSLAGRNGATVIMALILAVIIGVILATQPRNRLFVVAAVLTGFLFSLVQTTLNPHVAAIPVTLSAEAGSRYSVLPIFLLEAAVIVGVDYIVRRRAGARGRRALSVRPALAVVALIGVLGASWVADFRYAGYRSDASRDWQPIAAQWQRECGRSQSGEITVRLAGTNYNLPCDRMHA
jgi:hypothetical protein